MKKSTKKKPQPKQVDPTSGDLLIRFLNALELIERLQEELSRMNNYQIIAEKSAAKAHAEAEKYRQELVIVNRKLKEFEDQAEGGRWLPWLKEKPQPITPYPSEVPNRFPGPPIPPAWCNKNKPGHF